MSVAQAISAGNLDRQLPALQSAAEALRAQPPMGWIAAIRTALGMSATYLASQLEVSHATVLGYEKAEVMGRIQVETLRRVAEALDAELVLAIVPRRPIAATLRDRAEAIARDEMQAVVQTMRLEGQQVDTIDTAAQTEQMVRALLAHTRRLWR